VTKILNSQAELENLIAAAEKVCASQSRKSPALMILRKKAPGGEHVNLCSVLRKLARPEREAETRGSQSR
jgi:hypothetical protein